MACKNKGCAPTHPSLLTAACTHYEAQRDEALAVLNVYFNNPVAIADHSNFLEEIKSWTSKLAEAEENLAALQKNFLGSTA